MELEDLLQDPVVKPLVETSPTARFAVEQCYNCKYFKLMIEAATKYSGPRIGKCRNPKGTPTVVCREKKLRWDMRDDVNIPDDIIKE